RFQPASLCPELDVRLSVSTAGAYGSRSQLHREQGHAATLVRIRFDGPGLAQRAEPRQFAARSVVGGIGRTAAVPWLHRNRVAGVAAVPAVYRHRPSLPNAGNIAL